ncbi:MAG TPA: thioredoxin domain-containing protein [Solirubrobacterales bacterium]
MSEAAATPIPRRGRPFVIVVLLLALLALGYALVQMATREAGRESIRISGVERSQATFGGVPQAGDRLGSADAPVSIQVFADLQCSTCRDSFLGAIPGLVESHVRPGEVKLLLRHYSVARNPLELGFFGAEAAAEQGYGWQYTYLFFRNQTEAERFGVGDRFLESVAGSIGELDVAEWNDYLDREGGTDGAIARRLEGYEELGRSLGIRLDVGTVVNGPEGTRMLQDGPSRAAIERAISEVGGRS